MKNHQINLRDIFGCLDTDEDGWISILDFRISWKKYLLLDLPEEEAELLWFRMGVPKNSMLKYEKFIYEMCPKTSMKEKGVWYSNKINFISSESGNYAFSLHGRMNFHLFSDLSVRILWFFAPFYVLNPGLQLAVFLINQTLFAHLSVKRYHGEIDTLWRFFLGKLRFSGSNFSYFSLQPFEFILAVELVHNIILLVSCFHPSFYEK